MSADPYLGISSFNSAATESKAAASILLPNRKSKDFLKHLTARRVRPRDRAGGVLLTLIRHAIPSTTFKTEYLFNGGTTIKHECISFIVEYVTLKSSTST